MNISITLEAQHKARLRFRHKTEVDFIDEHGKVLRSASSTCHADDPFTKVEGEIKALDHLLLDWSPLPDQNVPVQMASKDRRRIRKSIWLQYFSKRAPEFLKDAVYGKGVRS
jgi:hypothetical protein